VQELRITAAALSAPDPLPRLCARHGEAAETWRAVTFGSRLPWWGRLVVVLGFMTVTTALRRHRLHVPAWPFCRRCVRRRRVTAGLAVALGLGWLIASTAVAVGYGVGTVVGVLGLCSGIMLTRSVTVIMLFPADWSAIVGGVVTADGEELSVPRAADAFANALPGSR